MFQKPMRTGNKTMKKIRPLIMISHVSWQYFSLLILALMALIAVACASSTDMDIDYSHNVVGTGTVMTDFVMGSDESTVASGRVRGSGEVVNKYVFVLNSTDNVSIEDQFLFTKAPAAQEAPISSYPQMTSIPSSFRLLGTSWAAEINLTMQNELK